MNSRIRLALSIVPLAFAWGLAWWHLSSEWSAHPQYEYGWGVPVLFAVLVWQQWRGPLRPPARGAPLLGAIGLAVWTLGEVIREHDPIWRITGGLLMSGCTLISAAWLLRTGGAPLLRREMFPLLFAWTALPWPMPIELALTQHLLRFVTSAAVFCAAALGIPALQRGNAIELATGFVGVEDACSGVQSLQAALMAALFLAGLYRLGLLRGLALLGGAMAAALLGNLLRVLALTAAVAHGGAAAAEAWHDAIGMCATLAVFGALWLLALLLRTHRAVAPEAAGTLALPSPAVSLAALAWLVGAVAFWNAGGAAASAPARWKIDLSALPPGWRAEAFTPTRQERALLRFAESGTWRVHAPNGGVIWLYHFLWEGDGMPPFAFSHTPAMCMPWKGWASTGAPQREMVPSPAGPLPAMLFSFEREGERVSAVQVVSAGGQARHFTDFDPFADNRLQRIFATWRAPREHIDEELLLYFATPARGSAAAAAGEILRAVLGAHGAVQRAEGGAATMTRPR